MSLREKILIGLVMVAVCLGGLALTGDGRQAASPEAATHGLQPLTEIVSRLTTQLDQGFSLTDSRYVLAAARSPWQASLFGEEDRLLPAAGPAPASPPALATLVYSGFIETAQRRVAVIDGIEYVEGDQLKQSLYTVRHIGPDQVLIEAPQQPVLAVPLVEGCTVEASK